MFEKDEPLITIVKNPKDNYFSITLQHWDTPETVNGYSREEAKQLITQLESAIHHLDICWDECRHESLFENHEIDNTTVEKIK